MADSQVERLAELVKGIESVMFTTVHSDGSVHSRPMVAQDFAFDGDLWFFSQLDSAKVDAVQDQSHVCVAFMDPSTNRYVSVSGWAEIVMDRATQKKMWSDAYRRWFPDGLEGGQLALIRVNVTHAEAWDTPHANVTERFSFASPPPYKKLQESAHLVRSRLH
jgi:general stress protein 26